MKFITVSILNDDYDEIHINIDHIVSISDEWVEQKVKWKDGHGIGYEEMELLSAKILLSNGSEIICQESVQMIQKEYKELFKQY